MERELLVLGLLKSQSQHGYMINEFIEHNLGRVSNMKKSTAYSILKRLERSGDVVSSVGQEGNRPAKLVYSITQKGEKMFEDLLRKVLISLDDATPSADIGIMFLDHLSISEAMECLIIRLNKVNQKLEMYRSIPKHEKGFGVDLAIQHRVKLISADREWLIETIETLKNYRGGEF